MTGRRAWLLPLLALPVPALGCAVDTRPLEAQAQQPPALALSADARDLGYVGLRIASPPGEPIDIWEDGRRVAEVTPTTATTSLRRVVPWRCDRRRRNFAATSRTSTVVASVRTPSCARRLALAAPGKARAERRVVLRLVDRWRLGGLTARLCVEPPGGPERCRRERLRTSRRATETSFRALRPGGWRVSAKTPWGQDGSAVRATSPGPLALLATGDSMIQVIDGFLKQRLRSRGVRVRSDAHISTGISKPSLLDWQAQARRHAARRPDVVVMFLGANDGFPMGSAPCCAYDAWIGEYARRAERMMDAYGRGGRARVYWLLLPTPRGGFFRETFPAVNAAIRQAAGRSRRDVGLIDLVDVFTPGGRYRDTMRIGNREVRVRQSDGVHLNTDGAALAASVIVRTLRDERILR